jgi:pimeloyl-ACP methyl ester carboxylesterase
MVRRPDLLLLPGMLSDATFWGAQIEALAGARTVHVPHYGLADSIAAMADAVLKTAPTVFDLAGHSMGGRVAQEICRRVPARVRRLALFATDFRAPADEQARRAEAAQRDVLLAKVRRVGIASWAEEWSRAMVAAERQADRPLLSAISAMIARHSFEQIAAHTLAGLSRPDFSQVLPDISCPTLVCAGAEDRLRTADAHRSMAALIPGAQLIVLERCGHMLAMEKPNDVTAAMRGWLTR